MIINHFLSIKEEEVPNLLFLEDTNGKDDKHENLITNLLNNKVEKNIALKL